MGSMILVDSLTSLRGLACGSTVAAEDVALVVESGIDTNYAIRAYILMNEAGYSADNGREVQPSAQPDNYWWKSIPFGFPANLIAIMSDSLYLGSVDPYGLQLVTRSSTPATGEKTFYQRSDSTI